MPRSAHGDTHDLAAPEESAQAAEDAHEQAHGLSDMPVPLDEGEAAPGVAAATADHVHGPGCGHRHG